MAVYTDVAAEDLAAFLAGYELGELHNLGITAGASAPETLVEEIIGAFAERYSVSLETVSAANEDVFFPLPRPLRNGEAAG